MAGASNGTDVISDTKVYDYVYNGSSLTRLTITTTITGDGTSTKELYFTYDGSSPMTVTYNGDVFYYVTNLQGDVVAILDDEGYAVVEYAYDAWGNILTTTGSMASTLGVANPFTYRGYVYDTESGLYYLQSRYYDPEVGRFINADALVTTGQGFLGNNMFAYCGNNPINYADPTGTFWWPIIFPIILPFILGGCAPNEESPNQTLADAPDLDIKTASNESYNCYGNAIMKQIDANPTGYKKGMSADEVFALVQRDLGGEANCKRLESIDSPVEEGWYMVALMCGSIDYHFVRLTDGRWYNKSGNDPRVGGCYVSASMVNTTVWYAIGDVNGRPVLFNGPNDPVYYSESGPVYFAVRIGWDEGG